VVAELQAVANLRCGGSCKSEEEGAGGVGEFEGGQHRGSGWAFIGRGGGRGTTPGAMAINGHGGPSTLIAIKDKGLVR
jgi:hypothetical protein